MAEPVKTEPVGSEAETAEHTAEYIAPADEHNRRLVGNVHPSGWTNPEPKERYHLLAIGAGTAGLVSAIGAAGLGARAGLVERHLMGGDCLNVGCVPSKAVIRAARAWHDVKTAAERFGAPPGSGAGHFAFAMERMRRLRADISRVDSARRFTDAGVDVHLGEARFVAPDAVEVAGRRLTFRCAVIATGARAAAPPIPGLADAGYLTNETVFELTELPASLAVIGGGPIGCELAQAFACLGAEVTLLDMADQVLTREDRDAAAIVQRAMGRDGVRLELGAKITRVSGGGAGEATSIHFERDGEERKVTAERVLVAVGRKPNVEGLGLEAAGVEHNKQGVVVDDRLRTANPRIYAAGDVAGRWQFTHAADAMARIVIQNALFFGRKKASDLVIPWCTYTSPEVAHVGLSPQDAEEKGIEIETLTLPLEEVDRALLDGDTDGFLRIHADKKGRVAGATLVAAHAGDMLGELCLAATAGVGLGTIAGVIHPYPTQGEVVKKAADAWRRGKLTPAVKKAFGWWFRFFS